MSKFMYSVVIIAKGKESDYKDYWDRNLKKNAQGKVLRPELLSVTFDVEAKNQEEATALARAKYPGQTIAACSKIG